MKIIVTSEGQQNSSQVDPRFGRAQWFVLYDTETKAYESFNNEKNLNLAQGAGIQAARQVIDHDAAVVLTGHCGPKAFETLAAGGVKIVTGATGSVVGAINSFLRGELKMADSADVQGHW